MRKSQEANDSVTIEQEQADQVRRTVGATLAARALEEVLPAIGKGYAPQAHRKAAERMSKDMEGDGRILIVKGGRILAMEQPDAPCNPFAYPRDARVCTERMASTAPDLYAACEARIAEWYADSRNIERAEPESVTLARAALAAARGEGRGG